MDLFNQEQLPNILPFDGVVHYHGTLLSQALSLYYYEVLRDEVLWKHDEALIFGKRIVTKRKVAWYADESYEYSYSNITKKALPWTAALLALKAVVEKESKERYNSCLLNLYHSGNEGMSWHSDGEKMLKKNGAIASLTFGAERKFWFKHKVTKQKVGVVLQNGSLLVMKDQTQSHWLHRLPPTKLIQTPRINLTFRTIIL